MGNAALQFGGLFRLDIYRVRSSIFGYSGILTDYGVRGLGLLGWLPLTGPASYIHSLLGDLVSLWPWIPSSITENTI